MLFYLHCKCIAVIRVAVTFNSWRVILISHGRQISASAFLSCTSANSQQYIFFNILASYVHIQMFNDASKLQSNCILSLANQSSNW